MIHVKQESSIKLAHVPREFVDVVRSATKVHISCLVFTNQ